MAIPDKRMTEEEVVAELRDGMTIGIGGWGSRRKPMSLIRAILMTMLRDRLHDRARDDPEISRVVLQPVERLHRRVTQVEAGLQFARDDVRRARPGVSESRPDFSFRYDSR